ncbi:hypothetical protein JIN84_22525 [Luteolibacter yonseiensis]|uniref:DUF4288 domain-containing protein n=1 Tax=Luteolibacter yonseiensis TaxID=1144680 RepID=A0A934R6W5_9BACT|nr:hypothetical protein [Luteolibacter yonseiensis]MBK1818411.1 hypothetical protein [Luteolibacter yonseiensis]
MNSYSVRCIFEVPKEHSNKSAFLYEERITIWRAKDIDEAIDKAAEEAEIYADSNSLSYTGLAQAYWMFTKTDLDGVEVFSLMRESGLKTDDYLDAFFSTGNERQKGMDLPEPL